MDLPTLDISYTWDHAIYDLIVLEGERKKRNIDLFFHLFMHLLVDYCVCPDWGLNLQS